METKIALNSEEITAIKTLGNLSKFGRICYNCGVCKTPLWRTAHINDENNKRVKINLCNACGLKHAKLSCNKCGGTYLKKIKFQAYCNICNGLLC